KGRRDVRERIRVGREEDARTGRADPTRAFDNLGGTVEGNGTLSAARAALHQGRLRSIKVEIDQGLLPRAELQQEAWKIAGLESEEVFDAIGDELWLIEHFFERFLEDGFVDPQEEFVVDTGAIEKLFLRF